MKNLSKKRNLIVERPINLLNYHYLNFLHPETLKSSKEY